MKLEIEIGDIKRDEVLEAAAYKLLEIEDPVEEHAESEKLLTMLKERLEEAATDAVNRLLDETIRARIAAEVDRVLTVGWAITDEHGRPTGKTKSITTIVLDALSAKGDRWSSNSRPLAESVAHDVLTRRMQSGFSKEIDDAAKAFRAQVDELLRSKLSDMLRQSLGLR